MWKNIQIFFLVLLVTMQYSIEFGNQKNFVILITFKNKLN